MAKVMATTDVAQKIIDDAAAWYAHNSVPQPFRTIDPRILRTAERLAKHDWQRCTVNEDGSVTVHNNRVWQRG
jgi:hypothetical protein